MHLPNFLLCLHPAAQGIGLAILAAFIGHAAIALTLRRRVLAPALAAYPAILLVVLWLGSYSISPLGFSSGQVRLLQGFLITRSQSSPAPISPGETVSVAPGAVIGIQTRLLPGPVECVWLSANGGAFDDPASCDTAYASHTGAQYDVLRVQVRSACSLSAARGEIRISILP